MSFSMDDMTTAGRTTRRAIRLWEQEGLLGKVDRDDAGRRLFTGDQVDRAKIIGAAQMAGMSLGEIGRSTDQQLWARIDDGARHMSEVRRGIFGGYDL